MKEREAAPADFKQARRRKATLADPLKADRLPPHSIEAEQGVLGCVLLSPGDCLDHCLEKLKDGPDVFYDLRHRTVYETLLQMRESKVAIDLITIQQKLKDKQQLEGVGGLAYLASLPDTVPSAANLDYYVQIVCEKFVLRRLIGTCTEVVSRAYEHQSEVDVLIDEVERDILRIIGDRVATGATSNKQVMRELIDEWEAALNGTPPQGIRTGFTDFDQWTGGLKPAQLMVIAARPSRGKSSIALNIADHAAVRLSEPVAFFSLEMSRKEYLERAACSRARVDSSRLKRGIATQREIESVIVAQSAIVKAPLHIVDKPGLSVSQLSGLARTIRQRHDIKLVIVDHLGLLSCGERGRSRYEEITKISGALKGLAMELQLPVIAVSQLNRDCELDDREPRMSDLRDSGSIEQDADILALLHPNPEDTGDDQRTQLIVAKHRGGRTGVINLIFHRQWTRFDSASNAR